jgi:hypothetical protein
MARKLDNANLPAKLDLRRYFLRKYHGDGQARVMDCCAGDGIIWSALRREFSIASYWGIDTKPAPGRMAIDSRRILAQSGWSEDVVDVDTYGFPFGHYEALLKSLTHNATVFLTTGRYNVMGGSVCKELLSVLRMGSLRLPRSLYPKLYRYAEPFLLCPVSYGRPDVRVAESQVVRFDSRYGKHLYYGLRLICDAQPAA